MKVTATLYALAGIAAVADAVAVNKTSVGFTPAAR